MRWKTDDVLLLQLLQLRFAGGEQTNEFLDGIQHEVLRTAIDPAQSVGNKARHRSTVLVVRWNDSLDSRHADNQLRLAVANWPTRFYLS